MSTATFAGGTPGRDPDRPAAGKNHTPADRLDPVRGHPLTRGMHGTEGCPFMPPSFMNDSFSKIIDVSLITGQLGSWGFFSPCRLSTNAVYAARSSRAPSLI